MEEGGGRVGCRGGGEGVGDELLTPLPPPPGPPPPTPLSPPYPAVRHSTQRPPGATPPAEDRGGVTTTSGGQRGRVGPPQPGV